MLGITHKLNPDHGNSNQTGEQALDALGYGCIVVAGLALAVRRRFPITVLAVVTTAIVVYATRTYTVGTVYVLLALAIVIALMGIANTLALAVYERTAELGVLRALPSACSSAGACSGSRTSQPGSRRSRSRARSS